MGRVVSVFKNHPPQFRYKETDALAAWSRCRWLVGKFLQKVPYPYLGCEGIGGQFVGQVLNLYHRRVVPVPKSHVAVVFDEGQELRVVFKTHPHLSLHHRPLRAWNSHRAPLQRPRTPPPKRCGVPFGVARWARWRGRVLVVASYTMHRVVSYRAIVVKNRAAGTSVTCHVEIWARVFVFWAECSVIIS